LEFLARKGDRRAVAMLHVPDYPPEIEYLREWARELHGKSGVGMNGIAPLSYATVESWSRLKGVDVMPHEIDALFLLDSVMIYPGNPDEDDK
jgi:hypothetical protein